MITRSGQVVKQFTPPKRTRIEQPVSQVNGLTGVPCGNCRTHTMMAYEVLMKVGTGKKQGLIGGWDDNLKWIEVSTVRYYTKTQRVWVCDKCYGNRAVTDIVKRYIPIRDNVDSTSILFDRIVEKLEAKRVSLLSPGIQVRSRTATPLEGWRKG